MRGQDFLKVATDLAMASDTTQGALRTAVSRAYYAAFLEAREVIRPFQGKVGLDGYGSHRRVRELINNCGVERCNEVFRQLADLYKRREDADYDLKVTINALTVRLCLRTANEIIDYVNSLTAPEPRRRLREGLYRYLEQRNELGNRFPRA
jgi:uncharacterized protein (UPF0332 family)